MCLKMPMSIALELRVKMLENLLHAMAVPTKTYVPVGRQERKTPILMR